MDLPSGLTQRSLTPSDAHAAWEVIAADELDVLGSVEIEVADIVGDWQRPSHDLASRTVGVLDGERLVASGELQGRDRGEVYVHPEYRGRGIGTALTGWLVETARAVGSSVVGQPVLVGSPGDRLLESLGWEVRWTSWVLAVPEGASIAERPLPEGWEVRAATPSEYPAAHTVLEDAFLEWSVRDREPFADFEASVLRRPGFEPWMVRVVVEPGAASGGEVGEVVGVACLSVNEGTVYVSRLAVRRDRRHRGLAQALLVDAFGEGRAHGHPRAELSTDSRTGALGLYERVGMVPTSTWVNRARQL